MTFAPARQTDPGLSVRLRLRRRLLSAVTISATVLVVLAGSLPDARPASSAPGDGSARSQAASVTPGAGLTLATRTSFLGGLGVLDTITSPLTTSVVTPIVNALVALPNAMTTGLTNALVSAGLAAQNSDGQQARPASGFPTCGQRGWDSTNCYGPVTPGASIPPALVLTTGAVQGYATADKDGYVAASRAANPNLTVLGFPLGDLGVVSSSASCKVTAASCQAAQALTGGALGGGRVPYSFANGGPLLASIGGVPINATAVPIGVPGYDSTVQVNGNLATLTVKLTLPQLLTALGLPSVLSSITGKTVVDDGTVAQLTIKIGPGAVSQASPASAWGADVSIDLSVAIKLRVLGLATATITSTSTPPSLTDLKLAFSSATAGNPQPGWVPPAVV